MSSARRSGSGVGQSPVTQICSGMAWFILPDAPMGTLAKADKICFQMALLLSVAVPGTLLGSEEICFTLADDTVNPRTN